MDCPYLVIGALTTIGGWVGGYFGSYFKKKGENLATKDDIGDITTIVKGIESEFVKNNDILRSTLDLQRQHTLDWKSAERNAYFEYTKSISELIYSLSLSSANHRGYENYHDLYRKVHDFNLIRYKVNMATAHLELFIKNDIIFETLNADFQRQTIDLESHVLDTIDKIIKIYIEGEHTINNQDFPELDGTEDAFQNINVLIRERDNIFLEKYRIAHDTFAKIIKHSRYGIEKIEKINSPTPQCCEPSS